jgi:hypothetical protein
MSLAGIHPDRVTTIDSGRGTTGPRAPVVGEGETMDQLFEEALHDLTDAGTA